MAPSISRHHVDVSGRRVHLQRAGRGPPVLLLHESPRSSAASQWLLLQAPAGVSVLALDTPGNGLSEPLPWSAGQPAPSAYDYADALAGTMTALGIERAAVYGRHSGAAFGCALALRHPQRVSCLVLDGVSAFTSAEQAQWLEPYLPPFVPRCDGSHMAWLWSRVRDQALFFPWHDPRAAHRLQQPLPTPAALHAVALDLLLAGDAYRAPYRAAFTFDPSPVLPRLSMPTEVAARHSDVLRPHQARLPPLPAHVRLHPLADDRTAVGAQVWAWLVAGARGLADAPAARDAALPVDRLGDTLAGPHGRRIHLRGSSSGSGRPRVWLHPSPGGARGLDRQLAPDIGQRPVLALDLPYHGESDAWAAEPEALLDHLQALLHTLGLDDAELHGEGLGAAVATALAGRLPGALGPVAVSAAAPGTPPKPCPPRADGGHLLAAWLHARDEVLLGGWWPPVAPPRHEGDEAIDLPTVQARAIAFLREGKGAGAMRRQWLQRCRAPAGSGAA